MHSAMFFFFNNPATTEIYTLSLHDALPIWQGHEREECEREPARHHRSRDARGHDGEADVRLGDHEPPEQRQHQRRREVRSEEHTSELQSRQYLVCRLLLEKKKKTYLNMTHN